MIKHLPTRKRNTDAVSRAIPDELESNLFRLQDQLQHLRAQVRQAQQLAGLGTIAATIAHEVNNLLTPILSYARVALDSDDAELRHKALSVTVKNTELLVSMTDRVLTISAAKQRSPCHVSVRAAAEDAVASLCRDPAKDGISFRLEVADSLVVWVDPLHLQQVFFNLFLNARKAMSGLRQGKLKVCGYPRNNRVIIEIKDTGTGIPPEFLPHIFDPLQSSKAHQDGPPRCSGLGLALCRDLIAENDGTINVSSEPNVGTSFVISLPSPPPLSS